MKRLLLLTGLSLLSLLSWAQQPSGIDPQADSASVRAIRARMDSIRRRRPTVGLVLSGGGAKGAAEVGAIKYIEEMGIPVDIVVGTSVGGLVGAIYALGYTPAAMDSIFLNMDWNTALSDRVPREYVSYAENKYKEKYMLSFPFFYSRKDMLGRSDDVQFDGAGNLYEDLHLGAGGREDASKLFKDNILGSLPSGYVFGQNVNNIISSLTVGYQDSTEFVRLPIPFVCVATEMVTSKPKIWYSGKINTAMRSTMSIPGLFAPVKQDGMVLVDGGMRNNYPVDLAISLGADLVIGIDLSNGFNDYQGINNLLDIIMQGVDMLGRGSYESNVRLPEITIKPDMTGYDMLSFDRASVDTLMQRGYRAAVAQRRNLEVAKLLVGDEGPHLGAAPAVDMSRSKVSIWGIEILGVSDRESRYLMEMLKISVPALMGKEELDKAVATIYGTKAFDYVTYELVGEEEPFRLRIHCKRGPVHQLGIGGRFDTEEIVALLLNLGINTHRIQGSSLNLTGKVGTNPYLLGEYFYKSPRGTTLGVSSQYKYVDRDQFSIGESRLKAAYHNYRSEIFLSNLSWKRFNLRTGIRGDGYRLKSVMTDRVVGDYDLKHLGGYYVSAFLDASAETLDDGYFPSRGLKVDLGYQWVPFSISGAKDPFHVLSFKLKGVAAGGQRLAFIPSFSTRMLFGSDIPMPYINTIGGSMEGRYLDQQLPFIGINNAAAASNLLFMVRGDIRFSPLRNNYITLTLNAVDSFDSFKEADGFNKDRAALGVGLEYAYYTIAGPLRANIHWSGLTHKVGAYLGLGFDF